jgi:serine O-acetyltransferase
MEMDQSAMMEPPNLPDNNIKDDLGVGRVVAELKALRLSALAGRNRTANPPKLPSRKILADIVDGLGAALFPNRLGLPDLQEDGLDYFVGHTLDTALRNLLTQVRLELKFAVDNDPTTKHSQRACSMVRQFAMTLPKVRQWIDSDISAAYEGDPAARSVDEVLVCYPGINAILHYRLAHELHLLGLPLVARMISELAHPSRRRDRRGFLHRSRHRSRNR